jgi:hypothetical protein
MDRQIMEDPFAKWRTQPTIAAPAESDPFAKWRAAPSAPAPEEEEKSPLPGWMQSVHETIAPDKVLGYPAMLSLAIPGVRAPGMGLPTRTPMPQPAPKVAPNTEYPTAARLKEMSQGLYKEAEGAGIQIKPEAYNRLAYGLVHKMKQERLHPKLHQDTYSAVNEIFSKVPRSPKVDPMSPVTGIVPKETKTTFSLGDIDQLRQLAGKAKRGFDPQKEADRRLAKIATDRIDEWLTTLKPSDVVAGDAVSAVKALKTARPLWQRMRKAETIEKIHERALNRVGANYSNAGMQTALRQELKNLANSPKISRFNKEEQEVIKRIVRGASGENLLRWVGKFAPTSPMSAVVSMFVGAPGGPVGQAALMGAGAIARGASARMGAKKFDELNALVHRGYTQGGASY